MIPKARSGVTSMIRLLRYPPSTDPAGALDSVAMEDAALLSEMAAGFWLGPPLAAEALHGGANRVWRVGTAHGTFAVHQLLGVPDGVDIVARCQRIFELEDAALRQGVPLAAPVLDVEGSAARRSKAVPGAFTVHEWVDGTPLEGRLGPAELYRHLGAALGVLHSLDLPVTPLPGDAVESRPSVAAWQRLAAAGAARGWSWSPILGAAAEEFAETLDLLDRWEADAGGPIVFSHRDLTSANVLERDGRPVLIDWESAGPVARGVEIGRTALDQLPVGTGLDRRPLQAFVTGYRTIRPLPAVGPDWCCLWLRGLIVFAEHCARSCVDATAPRSLLARQAQVVESAPEELRRRLRLVDELVAVFDSVARD